MNGVGVQDAGPVQPFGPIADVDSGVSTLARLAVADLEHVDPVEVADLDALLDAATRHHLLAFVRRSTDDGLIVNVDQRFRSELERRARNAAATTLAGHAAAIEAIGRLRAVGLDPIVLKGCATGHLDHEQPHHRFTSDVDLLVGPGSLSGVLAAELGTVPPFRGERWQRRFARSTTILDRHGKEIDVHQRLLNGYFGYLVPAAELMEFTDSLRFGGIEVRALDEPGRLLHAAMHATTHNAGMHSIRDVPQLVLGAGVDWREAIARVERWSVEVMFAAGVRRAWTIYGLEPHPLSAWAAGVTGAPVARSAWWLTERVWNGALVAGLLALPPHSWPAYLGPLVLPSRDYLASERVSWSGRLTRIAGRVTGRS